MKMPYHKDAGSTYLCRKGMWVRRNFTVRHQKIKAVRKNSRMEITVLGKSGVLSSPVFYLM